MWELQWAHRMVHELVRWMAHPSEHQLEKPSAHRLVLLLVQPSVPPSPRMHGAAAPTPSIARGSSGPSSASIQQDTRTCSQYRPPLCMWHSLQRCYCYCSSSSSACRRHSGEQ